MPDTSAVSRRPGASFLDAAARAVFDIAGDLISAEVVDGLQAGPPFQLGGRPAR